MDGLITEINDVLKGRGNGDESACLIWESWDKPTVLVARIGGVRRRVYDEECDDDEEGERRSKVARKMDVPLDLNCRNDVNPEKKEKSVLLHRPTTILKCSSDTICDSNRRNKSTREHGKYDAELMTMGECKEKRVT